MAGTRKAPAGPRKPIASTPQRNAPEIEARVV